jgi:hypothetical protein
MTGAECVPAVSSGPDMPFCGWSWAAPALTCGIGHLFGTAVG